MSLVTGSPTVAFNIGQKVYVRGDPGQVRFLGTTEFSTGQWVGIELDSPIGKNDGSVNGIRYFTCQKDSLDKESDNETKYYGIFVRPPVVNLSLASKQGSASSEQSNSRQATTHDDLSNTSPVVMGSIISRAQSHSLPPPVNSSQADFLRPITRDTSLICPSLAESKTMAITMDSNNVLCASQIEKLKAKLRAMERKRKEDYEKLTDIKSEVKDKLKLENIVQKLQGKMTNMSQELNKSRDQLKLLENEKRILSDRQDLHDEELENMTLDRELAESRLEELNLDIKTLQNKMEELELECEILREENSLLTLDKSVDELSEISQTNSAALIKSQNRTHQLEEALIALRDKTATKENELMTRIASLEDTEQEYLKLNNELKTLQNRYKEAQNIIEDFRGQLEDVLGSENIIERLTDQNLELQEQCENLKRTIEELEVLKELNEELELGHQLTETQLQSEIEDIESRFIHQRQNLDIVEERNVHLEANIEKFRELVKSLHSELVGLRSNNTDSTLRTTELVVEAKYIMDLNIKLQQSSIGTQAKEIDMELMKVNLKLAIDQMLVYKSYSSRSLMEDEQTVTSLFMAKRIVFKSGLLFRYFEKIFQEETQKEKKEKFTFSFFSSGNYFLACVYLCEIISLLESTVEYVSSADFSTFSSLVELKSPLESIENSLDLEISRLKRRETSELDLRTALSSSVGTITKAIKSSELLSIAPGPFAIYCDAVCDQTIVVFTLAIKVCDSVREVIINCLKFESGGMYDCELLTISNHLLALKHNFEGIFEKQQRQKVPSIMVSSKTINDCFKHLESIGEFICTVAFHLDLSLSAPLADEEIMLMKNSFDEMLLKLFLESQFVQNSKKDIAEDGEVEKAPFLAILCFLEDQIDIITQFHQSLQFKERQTDVRAPWEARGEQAGIDQLYKESKDLEIEELKLRLREFQLTLRSKEKLMEELEVRMALYDSKIAKASSQEVKIQQLRQLVDDAKIQERVLTEKLKVANQTLEKKNQDITQRQEISQIVQISRDSLGTLGDWLSSYSEKMKCQYLLAEVQQLQSVVKKISSSKKILDSYDWLDTDLLMPNARSNNNRVRATIVLKRVRDLSIFLQTMTVRSTDWNKWQAIKTTNSYQLNMQKKMVYELKQDLAKF